MSQLSTRTTPAILIDVIAMAFTTALTVRMKSLYMWLCDKRVSLQYFECTRETEKKIEKEREREEQRFL